MWCLLTDSRRGGVPTFPGEEGDDGVVRQRGCWCRQVDWRNIRDHREAAKGRRKHDWCQHRKGHYLKQHIPDNYVSDVERVCGKVICYSNQVHKLFLLVIKSIFMDLLLPVTKYSCMLCL